MGRILLSLVLLFFSHNSLGGSTWIHAVGINEKNLKQNYDNFYRSAVSFNQECAKSGAKPDCLLYINDNPVLRPNASQFSGAIVNNSGVPSNKTLKKIIAGKVQTAKVGDTVVISLKNHGSPVDGESPACVWLSSTDTICKSDLSEILKTKPNGVRVLISADACFTGAFADLSSSEVCTLTASRRLEFSYSRRDLWSAIADRHPRTLEDLVEPIIKESGFHKLLGSQVILQQLCTVARKKVSFEGVVDALLLADSDRFGYVNSACRDNDLTAIKLAKTVKQALAAVEKPWSCAQLDLPKVVCEARKRLESKKKEIAGLINQIDPIARGEQKLKRWVWDNANIVAKGNGEVESLTKDLSADEKREFIDSLQLGQTPDWKKFNGERLADLKKVWQQTGSTRARFSEAWKGQQRIDAAVKDLKRLGVYDDLLILQSCFYSSSPQANRDLFPGQEIGKQFPERKFTEQDYLEAKQCEASVRF